MRNLPETLCDIDNPLYEMRADKVKAFLSYEPHKFCTVNGQSFFEDPHFGDEAGLVVLTPDCQLFSTDMIDPTRAELLDITENNVIEELYPKFQFV